MLVITPIELIIAGLPVLYGVWKVAIKPTIKMLVRVYNAVMGIAGIQDNLTQLQLDMKPNGGTSLRDAVDRVERVVTQNSQIQRALLELLNTGFFLTDAKGSCIHVSRYWQRLTGMSADSAMGTGWVNAIHEEDREFVLTEWEHCAQEGRPFSATYRIVNTVTREVLVVTGQSIVLRGPNGEIAGHIGTVTEEYE